MKSMLRWVLLFPGAVAAGYLAYLVGGTINRFTMTMFIGSLEGWYDLAAVFMEQMYFAACALYIGGRIAPYQKRLAILVLSGLLLLFVGFSTALVLTQPSSVSLPASISSTAGVVFAIGGVIVALERGQLDLGQDAV